MKNQNAFTFIEIIIVIGIIAILFSLSVPQLFRMRDHNTLQTSSTTLISLIRQQQLNAMNSPNQYGIHFEQSRYVLFTGLSYSSDDPFNSSNTLDYPLQFVDINLPSSELVFASGSGEIVSFDPNNHSFVLKDTLNNNQKTVQFNLLGVPISIQ